MNYCVHNEIFRMLAFMEKHYWEPIGIDEVAAAAGYSPRRCNLLFKAFYGETIGAYLRTLRMEDAKKSLSRGLPVDRVALSLSYTSRGFRKAFQEYYGVSPSQFVKEGKTYERYAKSYEYRYSKELWGNGANPTPDGLWEFAYHCIPTGEYGLMEWRPESEMFRAPDQNIYESPLWYAQNRYDGYGIHPGRACYAVRNFICPHSGTLEVFFSVGRSFKRLTGALRTPCSLQLYHNRRPLGDPVIPEGLDPFYLTCTCTVRAGDRIGLYVDPMGDHKGDGVALYRQRFSYLDLAEDPDENTKTERL